jgi:hypothetical protein
VPFVEAPDALRRVATLAHIGKIVVENQPGSSVRASPAS